MNYDSDEDITSSSIYDLDHAPPPPPQPAWTGTLMRGGSLSPVPTKTRKNIALPHGDNHSLSSSHTRESTSSRPTQRRHATFSGSASFSDINRFSSGSHNSSTPGRRRSYSQSSLPTSSSSVPNLNMLHGRSFPPDGKEPTNRKVAFANTRDHFSEPGMLHPPGMEEVKEEEEDAIGGKINLSGTEIDEVQSKPENKQLRSDSPSTPWSDYSEANGDEDYTENGDLNSVEISSKQPITMLGFKLPMWCSKRRISWNRKSIYVKSVSCLLLLLSFLFASTGTKPVNCMFLIACLKSIGVATCVVEKAPCFLCVRMKQGTYRSVLVRLNIMCTFFAIIQFVSAIWLYIVLENPYIVQRSVPTATVGENEVQRNAEFLTIVWNLNGPVLFLGTTSGVVLLSITLTVRVIRDVNLAGAIRYLWVLLWVIPMVVRSL